MGELLGESQSRGEVFTEAAAIIEATMARVRRVRKGEWKGGLDSFKHVCLFGLANMLWWNLPIETL